MDRRDLDDSTDPRDPSSPARLSHNPHQQSRLSPGRRHDRRRLHKTGPRLAVHAPLPRPFARRHHVPGFGLTHSNRNSQASPSPASDAPAGITAEQQISSLRRSNLRLETSLRATREREERLRANLVRLNETKARSEARLARATEAKDNLDNKIQALSTLNSRLATQLHDSHARLADLEGGKRAQEREVARLRVERGELTARLDKRRSQASNSRVLDSDRDAQIEAIARQAEQVHGHLKAALDKVAALCKNRSPAGRDCDSPTTANIQKQLGDIRFQLNLATTEQEQHRTRVGTLKSKSPSKASQPEDLNAIQEEEDIPLSPSSIPDEAEKSRKQREFSHAKAILARRHSATMRGQPRQVAARAAPARPSASRSVTAKLAAATEQGAKTQARLARAESSLDVALLENGRLDALLVRTNAVPARDRGQRSRS